VQAVELAREAAAVLHNQAVAAGHDPWKPYEFAVAEADRRGFDVESTKKGSPSLRGARARFFHRRSSFSMKNAQPFLNKRSSLLMKSVTLNLATVLKRMTKAIR
jgi:hypothetical protein